MLYDREVHQQAKIPHILFLLQRLSGSFDTARSGYRSVRVFVRARHSMQAALIEDYDEFSCAKWKRTGEVPSCTNSFSTAY